MSIKLGVVMDPIEAINYKKDSTLAMLWAAQDKNWDLYYMEQHDLYITGGEPRASMRKLKVFHDQHHWFELGEPEEHPVDELDIVLMRKDPPFDNEFVYSTYILEAAERRGCFVVNPPRALRDANEKITATLFADCAPPHVVTANEQRIRAFHAEHQDVILKPLDGMGGTNIFRAKPDEANLGVIIEVLTNFGQNTIMVQKFIPEISDGDKRILMIDGEPVDYCLARLASKGETRANLAAGGRGEARPLTERDRWICDKVKLFLQESHLLFVGLDVIGDYLTEVNVTSPTCIREIDAAYGTDIGGQFIDCVERKYLAREKN
ncbi:MAG: glutathione synthase [Pseudomonadales bacterium]